MLVPRLIDVLVPLAVFGFLLLIGVRFVRGTVDPPRKGVPEGTGSMWRWLGRIFIGAGIYFFATRFFR